MTHPFQTASDVRKSEPRKLHKSKGAPGGIIGELSQLCAHDYRYDGYSGPCVIMRCFKCGDEYEKDVS